MRNLFLNKLMGPGLTLAEVSVDTQKLSLGGLKLSGSNSQIRS